MLTPGTRSMLDQRWCLEWGASLIRKGDAMQLRHSTPACNVPSILTKGLDPSYAVTESDKRYVWLHTPQRTPWSIQHTVRRKKVSEDEIVVLEVTVSKSWLSRV